MKDASGASQMDPKTQITALHGTSMLDAAQFPVESNICLSLLRGPGSENDQRLINAAVGQRSTCSARRPWRPPRRRARAAMRPTRFWRRAASWVHDMRAGRQAVRALVEGFTPPVTSAADEEFDLGLVQFDGTASLFVSDRPDAKAEALLHGLQARA